MRLWLQKSAARPAGSRPRADAIRRAAERSRRAAECSRRAERPPQPRSPRGLRLELLADGRLQRARSRRLRTPTRGICRRVTGVSVRRPAASRPAGSRISFCTSTGLFITASRPPLPSSTVNVRLSAVFFRKYIKIFFTLIKTFFTLTEILFTLIKIFYPFIMESCTISSATTPADSILTVDSSSSIVVDSTSSSVVVASCSASAPASVTTVTDSDVPEPAMAVLHTIASPGDDGAQDGDDPDDGESDTLEHPEQIDPSSDELEILEAEGIAAAAAVAAADARLRFLRARRTSAQVSQASTRSARSAPGPAVRPLWLPDDLPDRGPLATVPQRPEVRRAVEPAQGRLPASGGARGEMGEGAT